MTDIQTLFPVIISDGTNKIAVTSGNAILVDSSSTTQPVSGTVSVSNLPTTQPISGSVSVSGTVSVSNFPTTQPVSGSVSVSNLPTTQAVSGTVAVSNFPTTQAVTVSNTVATTVGEVNSGIVVSYGVASAVTANHTGTITYTVTTGKTLYLKQVIASSSGSIKVTLSYGSTTPTNVFTSFTSGANLNISQVFAQPIAITSGTVLTITFTNTDSKTFDMYGTFVGHEQ